MSEDEKHSVKEIGGALSAVFVEDGIKSLGKAVTFIFEPIVETLQPELFGESYIDQHEDGAVVKSICATVEDFRDDLVAYLGGTDSYLMGKAGAMVVETAVGFYLSSLLVAADREIGEEIVGGYQGGGGGGETGEAAAPSLAATSPMRTMRNSLSKRQAYFLKGREKIKWIMERDIEILRHYFVRMMDFTFGDVAGTVVLKHFRVLEEVAALCQAAAEIDWEYDEDNLEIGMIREHVHKLHTLLWGASGGVSVPEDSLVWDMMEDMFSLLRGGAAGGGKVKLFKGKVKDGTGWGEWAMGYFAEEGWGEEGVGAERRGSIVAEMIGTVYIDRRRKKEREMGTVGRLRRRSMEKLGNIVGRDVTVVISSKM